MLHLPLRYLNASHFTAITAHHVIVPLQHVIYYTNTSPLSHSRVHLSIPIPGIRDSSLSSELT